MFLGISIGLIVGKSRYFNFTSLEYAKTYINEQCDGKLKDLDDLYLAANQVVCTEVCPCNVGKSYLIEDLNYQYRRITVPNI